MAKGIKYILLDEPTRKFLSELKNLRVNTGKNQLEVARMLNIPNVSYSKYERGENFPSLERLIKLAEYFSYDLSDSLNYKYYHGEVNPYEIKRKLMHYGLTYSELQEFLGVRRTRICNSVHLQYWGSLSCLASVLKFLQQEEDLESFRKELLSKKKVKRCRKH